MPTLFAMTVDTEEEWDWDSGWPTSGYSVGNVARLPRFQDLCSRYQVATTYFANLAVLEDATARAILLDLASKPHVEVGMHIHPWNTPPLDPTVPVTARGSFLHTYPAHIIRAKLESVHARFLEAGLRPTSFRGGRYSSGPIVHEVLASHGFLADASVVPFTTWPDDGAPDYRHRDLLPVRLPPRQPGAPPLWEIPLTLAFSRRPFRLWSRYYEAVSSSWLSRLHLIGIGERLGLVQRVWLNFEHPLGAHMLPFLSRLRRLRLPCICFTLHSSSLMAGKSPYTLTPAAESRLFAQVERVFATLSQWTEFQSVTVTEVAQALEADHRASPRH
jgi:hypothetical protein